MSDDTSPTSAELPSWDGNDEADEGPGRSGTKRALIAGVAIIAGLLLVVGVVAVLSGNNPLDPDDLEWPAAVNGEPEGLGSDGADVTASAGVYAWSDFDGWHLRVVNGDGVAGIRGTIDADKDFPTEGTNAAVLSTDGTGTVSTDGKQVVFDLPADPQVSGLDFNTDFFATELTFTVETADGPLKVSLVTTGSDGTVSDMPFTIEKVEKTG